MVAPDLYKEVVDSISAHVAIIDEKGIILETNRAWDQFANDNQMEETFQSVGANYLNICELAPDDQSEEAAEAREVARGIRGVLTGDLPEFMTHYGIVSLKGCAQPPAMAFLNQCIVSSAGG